MEPSYSGETFWKGKLQYRMMYKYFDIINTAYLYLMINFHRVRFVFNFALLVFFCTYRGFIPYDNKNICVYVDAQDAASSADLSNHMQKLFREDQLYR
jgi:hypothetical protein